MLHTSLQKRTIHTAELALRELDRSWIPVRRSWRLNERHYGTLQGLDKKETAERFGAEQVKVWRRSYDIPPPPLDGPSAPRRRTTHGTPTCHPTCFPRRSASPTW